MDFFALQLLQNCESAAAIGGAHRAMVTVKIPNCLKIHKGGSVMVARRAMKIMIELLKLLREESSILWLEMPLT